MTPGEQRYTHKRSADTIISILLMCKFVAVVVCCPFLKKKFRQKLSGSSNRGAVQYSHRPADVLPYYRAHIEQK